MGDGYEKIEKVGSEIYVDKHILILIEKKMRVKEFKIRLSGSGD